MAWVLAPELVPTSHLGLWPHRDCCMRLRTQAWSKCPWPTAASTRAVGTASSPGTPTAPGMAPAATTSVSTSQNWTPGESPQVPLLPLCSSASIPGHLPSAPCLLYIHAVKYSFRQQAYLTHLCCGHMTLTAERRWRCVSITARAVEQPMSKPMWIRKCLCRKWGKGQHCSTASKVAACHAGISYRHWC